MRILIIRHGEPNYSIDSLTKKGWREAECLSEMLKNVPIDDFYCSPLGRAQDTARSTLQKTGKTAEILPWLREFSGTVTIPGEENPRIPWNFLPQFWTKEPEFFHKDEWLKHPLMRTGNVEEVFRETCGGFDDLLKRYGYRRDGYIYRCAENTGKTIALFCHFALGTTVIAYLLGISPVVLWQGMLMPPTSVTEFVTEERVKGEVFFRCTRMGDTSHLYAMGEPVSPAGLFFEQYNPSDLCQGDETSDKDE